MIVIWTILRLLRWFLKTKEEEQVDSKQIELFSKSPSQSKSKIEWFRRAVPHSSGLRTDIYYNILGTKKRLRSRNDARNYCESSNIPFDEKVFDFKGENKFTGVISQEIEANNLSEWQLKSEQVNIPNSFHEAMCSP